MRPKLIAAATLLALILVFAVQNTQVLTIRFLLWELSISQALLIFFTFAGGLLGGFALASLARRGV